MRTPVRFYITKGDDRTIVKGVPVFVASPEPATPLLAEEGAPVPIVTPRRARVRRVGRSMRSGVGRRNRAAASARSTD
ncbi:MAG: hypothetical protein M3R06_02305 [Chloroflexota bacterium]|nr:hypothetical protein [Chloroflexota bacterium]